MAVRELAGGGVMRDFWGTGNEFPVGIRWQTCPRLVRWTKPSTTPSTRTGCEPTAHLLRDVLRFRAEIAAIDRRRSSS